MKKLSILLLIIFAVTACKKQETLPQVTFKISVAGFEIITKDFGSLKSDKGVFDTFTHKYPSGILSFTDADGITYDFDTGSETVDEFYFTLPVGNYTLTGSGGTAERYGSPTMSFTISSQEIVIEESTTSVDITITPTCALILVADEDELVERAHISGETNRALVIDGIFRYSYFKPDRAIYIVKKDGAILTILGVNLQIGYVYQVIVTDTGTNQTLNFNSEFTDYPPISW